MRVVCLVSLWLGGSVACAPSAGDDALELSSLEIGQDFGDIRADLLKGRGDLARFEGPGPIKADLARNAQLRLGPDIVVFDNAVPRGAPATPLAILVHGNHSRKEAHRRQIERLASFGIHAVALEVPNQDQWIKNGDLVEQFVKRVASSPKLLGGHVNPKMIILAGHSFGGSAITLAAAKGAPVRGLVLLDPAVAGTAVEKALAKITLPVALLGADPSVFRSRRRTKFFSETRGPMLEVSVRGATHDDAQGPSMYAITTFGFDPFTSPERQSVFAALITASAFSLAATGSLDYLAEAVVSAAGSGQLKDPRYRNQAALEE